jgi:hypothetical protein
MGVGMLRRYHTQAPEHVNEPGDVEAAEEHQVVDDRHVDLEYAAERPDEGQSTPFEPDPEAEAAALDEDDSAAEDARPKGNASHEAWIDYAVAQGMARDDAEALSRDELRDRFTA